MGNRLWLLLALLASVTVMLASCGEGNDGAPTPDAGAPEEAGPDLVVRAITGRETPTKEGLFALDPLLPGGDPPGEPTRLQADGFSGGDAQFPFVYTQGTVVFRCNRGACALDVAAEDDLSRTIGEAWCIAPSAVSGRVWLAERDPDQPPSRRAIGSAREVDVKDGTVHAEIEVRTPDLSCPEGSFDGGLLFQDEQGLLALDASGKMRRILDRFVVGGHGALVVSHGESARGPLRLTDLESGEERRLAPPRGWRYAPSYDGDISPDGLKAAIPVARDDGSGGETFVAIVDLESGEAEVPGPAAGSLSFSADGQRLYAVGGPAGEGPRGFANEITAYGVEGGPPYVTSTRLDVLYIQATR